MTTFGSVYFEILKLGLTFYYIHGERLNGLRPPLLLLYTPCTWISLRAYLLRAFILTQLPSSKEYFLKKILFSFRERGREGERKERNIVQLPLAHPPLGTWPTTQECSLIWTQTCDFLVCMPALSSLSHTTQGPKKAF